MLQVCGNNGYSQLGVLPNSYIFPPKKVEINIYSTLCYALFQDYSLIIKQDGQLLAAGNNYQHKISGTFPCDRSDHYIEFELKDTEGNQYIPISVVSGYCQTVYLVTNKNDHSKLQLLYTHQYLKTQYPIVLKIGELKPIALFSGYHDSAAITSEGAIIYINSAAYAEPDKLIQPIFLPNGDKAINVVLLCNCSFSLGSSGILYISKNRNNYEEVEELRGIKITNISGVHSHCFAVSNDGKVYGFGSNSSGKLGLGKNINEVIQFTQISSLNGYTISEAYAGFDHSLFQTTEGKILACGSNNNGELLLNYKSYNSNDRFYYLPIETTITSNAIFCIAGTHVSAVFSGFVPPNCPNRTVTENRFLEFPMSLFEAKQKITELKNEISHLKEEIATLNQQNNSSNLIQQSFVSHQEEPFKLLDESDFRKYRQIREISFGSSGKIVEVVKEESFALKIMNIGNTSHEKQRSFIQEMEILTHLSHPNIIKSYGIYLGDETTPFSIVLEFCPQDLYTAIKRSSLSPVEIAKSIYQISLGMRYVHFCHLIHRDLKPQNILFGKDGLIRISDFGIAKFMTTEDQSMTFGIGTQKFMAPEILNEKDYNEKVDVYSFGVLLFFILSGGEMPAITIIQVGNGMKAPIPSSFTHFSQNLINKCWNTDPNERPTFKEICQELEENDYNVVQLSNVELNEVRGFANQHKFRIPSFSD